MKTKGILLIACLALFLHDVSCVGNIIKQSVKLKLPEQLNGYELLDKKIGIESFGKVMLAKHKRTGEQVAIKIIDKMMEKQKKSAENFITFMDRLKKEVENMKELDHPNIVKLYQIYETDDELYIVMEYSCGGNMYELLFDSPEPLSEKEARTVYRQLLSALEYLHRKNIVHRDVKVRNLLLDESKKSIKLANFGLSEAFKKGQNLKTHVGTLRYKAPEVVNCKPLDGTKADLWSSGIVLYLLMTGSLPFDDENLKKEITELNYSIPENVPTNCKDLLRKILVAESKRSTLKEIMGDKWVNEGFDELMPYLEPDPGQKLKEKYRRIKSLEELGYTDEEIAASLTKDSEYSNDVYAAYLIVGRRSLSKEQSIKLKLPEQLNGYRLLDEKIGSGNYGKVMLAQHKRTEEKVAIKIIDKITQKQKRTPKSFENFLKTLEREVENMKELDHPNIVKLFQVYETDDELYLVMEYSCGGDMYEYFTDLPEIFSEEEARTVYRQLLLATDYMHQKKIVHRDLKLRNILLDESQKNIKVADFGLSETFEPGHNLKTFCGSLRYMAPEVVNSKPMDGTKADLWSSGVILYTFVTGTYPFDGENLKKEITELNYDFPDNVSVSCKILLRRILVEEPKRATLREIMNYKWVNEGLDKLTQYTEPDPTQKLKEENQRIKALDVMGYTEEEIKASLAKGSEYGNDVYAAYLIVGRRSTITKNDKLAGLRKLLNFKWPLVAMT